jgi:hypothetical protein
LMVAWHYEGFPQEPRYMAEIAMKLVTEPLFRNPEI